jgi:hypothetical protein
VFTPGRADRQMQCKQFPLHYDQAKVQLFNAPCRAAKQSWVTCFELGTC